MFWKLSSAPSFSKVHHAVTPLSTHCLNPLSYSADLKLLSNATHLRTFVSFFILYFLITLNHSSSVNVVIESILFFNPFVYFLISNKALDRIFYKIYFHVFPFSRVIWHTPAYNMPKLGSVKVLFQFWETHTSFIFWQLESFVPNPWFFASPNKPRYYPVPGHKLGLGDLYW